MLIQKMVGMMLLKNITFPTDTKLYRKIIAKVQYMSRREAIELRPTHTRELKALKVKVCFMNHSTRMKEGKEAVKRMRTMERAMRTTSRGKWMNTSCHATERSCFCS